MRICWSCGGHKPEATAAPGTDEGAVPEDGDLSICITCGEWNVFEGDHLRKPTDDEFEEIGLDRDYDKIREAWIAMDAYRRSQAT